LRQYLFVRARHRCLWTATRAPVFFSIVASMFLYNIVSRSCLAVYPLAIRSRVRVFAQLLFYIVESRTYVTRARARMYLKIICSLNPV